MSPGKAFPRRAIAHADDHHGERRGGKTLNPDIAEISFGVQTGPQTSSRTAMQKLERGT